MAQVERGLLWARSLGPSLDRPGAVEGASFGEIGAERSGELAAAMGSTSTEAVRGRLHGGERAHAWWLEGRIVCYCWATTGSICIGEMDTRLRLPAGETYLFECATLPSHRGRGLYTSLLVAVCGALGEEGLRRAWIGADLPNVASQRAFASAGFQPALASAKTGATVRWSPPAGASPELAAAARALLDGPCR